MAGLARYIDGRLMSQGGAEWSGWTNLNQNSGQREVDAEPPLTANIRPWSPLSWWFRGCRGIGQADENKQCYRWENAMRQGLKSAPWRAPMEQRSCSKKVLSKTEPQVISHPILGSNTTGMSGRGDPDSLQARDHLLTLSLF